MNCENVRTQLSAYLDGELAPDEAEAVRAHLAWCPGCAEEYRRLTAVWDALLADNGIEPAPDFTSRFWRAAAAREERPSAFFRLLKWSPAIAAGFAAAFVAGWLSAGAGEPTAPSAEITFLRDYEIVQNMELLEDLPLLQVAELDNGQEGEE